jgi:hypothetical protein
MERTIYIPSAYMSENDTEADLTWDFISPGFGVVAVTREYAEQLALPETLVWREDPNKRVYVVEAYHAIHCVVCSNFLKTSESVLDMSFGSNFTMAAYHPQPLFSPAAWREMGLAFGA